MTQSFNTAKRNETFGFKLLEPWIDVTYDVQERTVKLGESYMKVLQEGQKTSFDFVLTGMKQVQELQTLFFDYFQDWARTGNETLTTFIRVQDEVRHDVQDRFEQHVSDLEKTTKVAK